jgi:predicted O-methyltransferase YrrM
MRRWNVLQTIINEEGFNWFVEVGCKEGRTTAWILEHCPDCHVITLDPWAPAPEQSAQAGGETYESWDFKAIEADFWRRVDPFRDRLTFYRKTSLEAADAVQDGSQDLVFIDAAHDYDSVLEDIAVWRPKLRDGGILAGHDFQHSFPSVMDAVADSFNLMVVQVAPDSVWWVRC